MAVEHHFKDYKTNPSGTTKVRDLVQRGSLIYNDLIDFNENLTPTEFTKTYTNDPITGKPWDKTLFDQTAIGLRQGTATKPSFWTKTWIVLQVIDGTRPVITPPAAFSTEATAVLTPLTQAAYGTATAVDDVDLAPVITNNAPATFPLGVTTITWTATDSSGNFATATQTVTVVDTTPPVITPPADYSTGATAVLTPLTTADYGTATATDIFPVVITNNAPATFPLGDTTITWTATDANGNFATATQKVTVVDITPPTGTISFSRSNGDLWGDVIVTVSCDDTGTGCKDMIFDPNGNIVPVGTNEAIAPKTITIHAGAHTVSAKLFDNAGNSAVISNSITLAPHATAISSFSIKGTAVQFSRGIASGLIVDTSDGNKPLNGVAVSFTDTGGIGFPTVTTNKVNILDGTGFTTSAGQINAHANTVVSLQYDPTSVKLTLEYPVDGTVTFSVVTSTASGTLDATRTAGTQELTIDDPAGIKSITFSSIIPGATIGIKNIVTYVGTQELENIGLGGLTAGTTADVGNGGLFGPNRQFTTAGDFSVTASSAANADYLAAPSVTTSISIEPSGGGSGAGTGVSFNGKIFSPYNCGQATLPFAGYPADDIDGNGNPDNDGDYICDRWEASSTDYPAATYGQVGIPFQIADYSSGGTPQIAYLPLASAAAEAGHIGSLDVYVEQDWFTAGTSTHKLRTDAVDAVKAVFLTHGIYLHVIDSDSMAEPATNNFVTIFTDSNTNYLDDFNTIKSKFFGDTADRLGISFSGTDVTVGTPSACSASAVTVNLSGINISTPTNAYGNAVSGTVTIQFQFTMPAGVTTATVNSISVSGTGAGLSVGTPSSRVDATVTSNIKTLVIFVPVSAKTVALSAVNLGTVTVTVGEGTGCGTTTTALVSNAVSATTSQQEAKAKAYHYLLDVHSPAACVSPTASPLSSGRSEVTGNDMTVSMGCGPFATDSNLHVVGNKWEQAGTFMHEMGHNLALNHGGPEKLLVTEKGLAVGSSPSDRADNCKPNELSVMSYSRQVPNYMGNPDTGGRFVLDFNGGIGPDIDEAALSEASGTYAATGNPWMVWANPLGTAGLAINAVGGRLGLDQFDGLGINWNLNTGAAAIDTNDFDMTAQCDDSRPGAVGAKVFKSWNEWANLNYNLRATISGYYDSYVVAVGDTGASAYPDTTLGISQGVIRNAKFFGMVPPPSLLGDEVRNAGSSLPLKYYLYQEDGVTLITSGEGFADITQLADTDINGNGILDDVVPVQTIGPFLFGGQHFDYTWRTPNVLGQYYFTIYQKIPGSTTEVLKLIDDTPQPSSTHPILKDAAGNEVTNKVKLQ